MKRWLMFLLAIAILLVLTACGGGDTEEPATETEGVPEEQENVEGEEETPPVGEEAGEDEGGGESEEFMFLTIDMMDSDGNSIGTAELSDEDNGVTVALDVEGLEQGTHGIHFHETGQCEAPDFESAGGHFNPTGASHGLNHPEGPHAGDLPNIEVGEDGTVSEEITAENVTLKSGEDNSLVKEGGTALIIHAGEDDGETQPSGDSGERIACGVVTAE
ncbi:superoxide dismutase family protein [Planococcus salinus]|uniref:Superoxide dismutase [Cu-Zn] n=1 Tax=Planococcus salinus TaxID=1848460 RepID=A0A3M8P9C8_9BACL|nr:superoxide dismutase family protein [Planococcus salinus]RNF40277.1 superoxide dismutase family protein [Planococcus salinus]